MLAPRRQYWKYKSDTFAPSYLNAYVANGAIITGGFGDTERDDAARCALAKFFPGREIVMLRIDAIAEAGGGVHCLTQGAPMNVEKVLIEHKFLSHQIDPATKILIIGTFNPAPPAPNIADFFYSRQTRRANELWKLLPIALGAHDLTSRANEAS